MFFAIFSPARVIIRVAVNAAVVIAVIMIVAVAVIVAHCDRSCLILGCTSCYFCCHVFIC